MTATVDDEIKAQIELWAYEKLSRRILDGVTREERVDIAESIVSVAVWLLSQVAGTRKATYSLFAKADKLSMETIELERLLSPKDSTDNGTVGQSKA